MTAFRSVVCHRYVKTANGGHTKVQRFVDYITRQIEPSPRIIFDGPAG